MKKIKKLLVVAVATAMLSSMSVNAFAFSLSDVDPTVFGTISTDSGVTYKQQFKDSLVEVGVPGDRADEIAGVLGQVKGLDNDKMTYVLDKVDEALGIIGTDFSTDALIKVIQTGDNQEKLNKIENQLNNKLGIYITHVAKSKDDISVKIYPNMDSSTPLLAWNKEELATFKPNIDKLSAAIQDEKTVKDIADKAVEYSEKGDSAVPGTTVNVWDTYTDEQKQAYVDLKNAEEEIDKLMKAGADGKELQAAIDKYNAAAALLPDSNYKTGLVKNVEDLVKEYGPFEEGKTYKYKEGETSLEEKNNQVAAEVKKNNAANKFEATNGKLKKTATNNGNMAVAGLAMIAVAGTVFVVSKKKIAE